METNKVTTADPDHPAYIAARVGALTQILPGIYYRFGIGSKKVMILKTHIDQMLTRCENILKEGQELTVSYEDAKKKMIDELK